MSEAETVALITAVASVSGALIQSGLLHRKKAADNLAATAHAQAPPAQSSLTQPPLAQPPVLAVPATYGKVWTWFLVGLCCEALLLPSVVDGMSAFNLIIIFPIVSLALSYWRPIEWTWAAVGVGAMFVATYLGSALAETSISGSEYDSEGDMEVGVTIYIINAVLVSIVSRYRKGKM